MRCDICGKRIIRGGQKGSRDRHYHLKCLVEYANRHIPPWGKIKPW